MSIMNLDQYLETLRGGKYLEEQDALQLCERVKDVMMEESNVQPVSAPVNIVGDVHGQLYDVLNIFNEIGG